MSSSTAASTVMALSHPKTFLPNMQVLRFAAAFMVLVSHLVREIQTNHLGQNTTASIEQLGIPWVCGVDIFFMISGFLMLYLTWDHFATPGYWVEFLKRRFIRVAPLYWFFTLCLVAITAVSPGIITHNDISLEHVATSLAFIPSLRTTPGFYPILVLGWTLNYEIMFYIVFAAVLWLTRRTAVMVLLAVFVAASAYSATFSPALPAIKFWTDPIILEFAMGMLLCVLYMRSVRLGALARVACILLGVILLICGTKFGLADTEFHAGRVARVIWASPCALILAGAMLGKQPRATSGGLALLVLGGDASYSLYLSHMFATRALTLLARATGMQNGWLFFICGLVLALLLAYFVLRFIERPLLAFLRWHFEPRRAILPA